MDIVQISLLTAVILSAFPLGKLLAKLTPEELEACRKTFRGIIIVSTVLLILSTFFNLDIDVELFAVLSMLFLIILTHESIKHADMNKKQRARKRYSRKLSRKRRR